LLAEWRADGTLAVDPEPRFYGYRMTFTDDAGRARSTTGVLGAMVLPAAAGEGDVLPHERTLPKAKSDRLALLEATRANLDPIWALSPAAGLTEPVAGGEPLGEVRDGSVHHELFAIDEPERIRAITEAVATGPLVLADGHHRFETAINYRNSRDGSDEGARAIMCLVVELADDQLHVEAINRLVHDLGTVDVVAALGAHGALEDAGPNTPDVADSLRRSLPDGPALGIATAERLYRFTPSSAALAPLRAELPEPLREVGAAWFDGVVRPLLGDATLSYRDDAATCAALVAKGQADAAVLLPPVTVSQIRDAANARLRMPEKTTFFAPKPRTGLVFRSLDD
jgi:uncharacterized protein (DUF1015 family)